MLPQPFVHTFEHGGPWILFQAPERTVGERNPRQLRLGVYRGESVMEGSARALPVAETDWDDELPAPPSLVRARGLLSVGAPESGSVN